MSRAAPGTGLSLPDPTAHRPARAGLRTSASPDAPSHHAGLGRGGRRARAPTIGTVPRALAREGSPSAQVSSAQPTTRHPVTRCEEDRRRPTGMVHRTELPRFYEGPRSRPPHPERLAAPELRGRCSSPTDATDSRARAPETNRLVPEVIRRLSPLVTPAEAHASTRSSGRVRLTTPTSFERPSRTPCSARRFARRRRARAKLETGTTDPGGPSIEALGGAPVTRRFLPRTRRGGCSLTLPERDGRCHPPRDADFPPRLVKGAELLDAEAPSFDECSGSRANRILPCARLPKPRGCAKVRARHRRETLKAALATFTKLEPLRSDFRRVLRSQLVCCGS